MSQSMGHLVRNRYEVRNCYESPHEVCTENAEYLEQNPGYNCCVTRGTRGANCWPQLTLRDTEDFTEATASAPPTTRMTIESYQICDRVVNS